VRNAGAVACLVAVAACVSDTVDVDSPALEGAAATACTRLVEALPGSVADLQRRPVDSSDEYAAAWGDPAIVLRCGVPSPEGFDRAAPCQETNGVGWFVPEEQITDQGADVTMTTIGFEHNVEVFVPASYRPPAAAMVDLAEAIKKSIREVQPCV